MSPVHTELVFYQLYKVYEKVPALMFKLLKILIERNSSQQLVAEFYLWMQNKMQCYFGQTEVHVLATKSKNGELQPGIMTRDKFFLFSFGHTLVRNGKLWVWKDFVTISRALRNRLDGREKVLGSLSLEKEEYGEDPNATDRQCTLRKLIAQFMNAEIKEQKISKSISGKGHKKPDDLMTVIHLALAALNKSDISAPTLVFGIDVIFPTTTIPGLKT